LSNTQIPMILFLRRHRLSTTRLSGLFTLNYVSKK